jgi:uncharacterized phage protein (TIGR01671 family)
MKTLKFRVWDKETGEWCNWHNVNCFFHLGGAGIISWFRSKNDDRFTVQQYTGMKDRNGKEVYEGDILKWGMSHDQETAFPRLRVVEFNEKQLIYKVVEVGEYPASVDYLYEAIQPSTRWCEVVGNIFENPELLE